MSREILFRGKRTDNSEWVKGNHLYDDVSGKHYIVPFGNITESTKVGQDGCCYCVGFEVIPETVGQYTGLTDKNGTKIFEGDILEFTDDDGDKSLYSVEWDNEYSCWMTLAIETKKKREPMDYWDLWKEHYEVVGNIHDLPELLKEAVE